MCPKLAEGSLIASTQHRVAECDHNRSEPCFGPRPHDRSRGRQLSSIAAGRPLLPLQVAANRHFKPL